MQSMVKALKTISLIAVLGLSFGVAAVYLAPTQVMAGLTTLQRSSAGVDVASIELPRDVRMAYWHSPAIAATPQAPLLLVHGITSNKDIWLSMLASLREQGYTGEVYAIDMPGHGDTSEPQDFDYRVESLAQSLGSFIAATGLQRPHVVGNSLGGLVSGLYVSDNPGSLSSLVLMNSAGIDAPIKSEMMARAMADRSFNPLLVTEAAQLPTKLAAVVAEPPSLPAPLLHMMASVELERLGKNTALFDAVLGDESNMHKLEPLLGHWMQPTLLLWGDSDNVFHASSVAKAQQIAGQLRARVLEHCGHLPMIEAPQATVAALTQFWLGG